MKRFLHNISFSSLQVIINQLFSLLIFFLLSKQLSKADFGEINWALAVFLTLFSILGFGVDQVIIRKIARKEQISSLLSMYVFHVLSTGIICYGSLLILTMGFPALSGSYKIFLILGLGKLFLFFSSPFKQASNGMERFTLLLYMSIPSSVFKGVFLTVLFFTGHLNLSTTILCFVIADCVELLVCFYIFKFLIKTPLSFRFKRSDYIKLLKESLPQLGVNVFSSGIARFDWIFIGLYLSSAKLAEYSFAYKTFELCTLPMLAIAPLLIPLFSRLQREGIPIHNNPQLLYLLEFEIIVACLVALAMNLGWVPMIDLIALPQYGSINSATIFILSVCMPVLFLNNFLWTLHFSEGRLRMIFRVFALTFVLNVVGDIILIPVLKNEGAALAYFFALICQTGLYLQKTRLRNAINWKQVFMYVFGCLVSGWFTESLFPSQWVGLPVGITAYIVFIAALTQTRSQIWKGLKKPTLIQATDPITKRI